MAKRLSRQEKEQNAVVDIINEMFRIAGHQVTFQDVEGRKDDWFNQWTMTDEQYHEWLGWGKKYLQNNIKMYARMAEREMAMIGLMWGLKIQNRDENVL
jgi:hypothetical protein